MPHPAPVGDHDGPGGVNPAPGAVNPDAPRAPVGCTPIFVPAAAGGGRGGGSHLERLNLVLVAEIQLHPRPDARRPEAASQPPGVDARVLGEPPPPDNVGVQPGLQLADLHVVKPVRRAGSRLGGPGGDGVACEGRREESTGGVEPGLPRLQRRFSAVVIVLVVVEQVPEVLGTLSRAPPAPAASSSRPETRPPRHPLHPLDPTAVHRPALEAYVEERTRR